MSTQAKRREETCGRIIAAAVKLFSEKGFRGASTRDIATRAGVNQALISYHFGGKLELWKAAAEQIFDRLREGLDGPFAGVDITDPQELLREQIRRYVRFAAAHPEFFRLMVEEGKESSARMRWLVDTHMKPRYEQFERFADLAPDVPKAMLPHAFYAMAGGTSLVFSSRAECRRLTGVDPSEEQFIATHAEFMARLLVP